MQANTKNRLTALDQIVLAAADLANTGFTKEQLIIACFYAFPDRFAMRGHPEYPDTKRVEMELPRLLNPKYNRVMLVKTDGKLMKLNDAGHGLARELKKKVLA